MVTLIKGISIEGKYILPTIIIKGSWFMEDWLNENQNGLELLLLSNSGYMNEELGMLWLDYFISYFGAGLKALIKVLLFNGYSLYITEDF
jgi:hypothetical protein